ncbi:MAG: PQQ-binding-like beta-propeller repeat protein [Pirellulales bacterium]|nr:PQQ-binding-like beta-propeller repeat protein [Pirellulales bacterium]
MMTLLFAYSGRSLAWLVAGGLIAASCAAAIAAAAQRDEPADSPEPELRTWTDSSGKFQIEASMLGFSDGKVQLEKADGSQIAVPTSKLSKADQQYVRQQLSRRREPGARSRRTESQPQPAADDWPGWRGPNRDGKSADRGLLDQWPEGGPKPVWQASGIGQGFSSVAVAGGTVYITGDADGRLVLSALDLEGKRKWQVPIDSAWTSNHPGARSTPTVEGDRVYLLSGNGLLACVDAESGRSRWGRKAAEFGGRPGGWGYAESVLIHGDLAVFKPGGRNAIVALNKKTGEPVWTSSGFEAGPEYSSSIAIEHQNRGMIITGTNRGIVAVDPENGRMLWADAFSAGNTANCPTPAFADGYVFWANGYGKGGICLRLDARGKQVTAERAWETSEMDCHHGGYILHEGYIYGNNKNGFVCLDLKTGQKRWEERVVGKGSLCFADGMLYLFGERNGEAALATCSPEGTEVRGTLRVDGDGPSWAYPVVSGGRLYLRYDDNLYCYDVRRGGG